MDEASPQVPHVLFRASNELALHVPDPEAAEAFYVDILGCRVVAREPTYTALANGMLRLYLVRDPDRTHDAVVHSFDVDDRARALRILEDAGCSLVPIGPHSPGEVYVKDPFGVVFDVIARTSSD